MGGGNLVKKREVWKHMSYLKIIKQHVYLVKRKKTPTELPNLKWNKEHMKYLDIKLVCPITFMGSQEQIWYRSYIKMRNCEKI